MPYYRTAAKIDLDAIESNIKNIKRIVGEKNGIIGVVKADAYGHGAIEVAKRIEKYCTFFAVATMEEAMEIKQGGLSLPIILLGRIDPHFFPIVVENDIRPAIFSFEDAKALSDVATGMNKTALYHVALDTGMSRIGFQVDEESADEYAKIAELPNIKAEGIFSHYATADEEDLSKAEKQKKAFDLFIEMLQSRGITFPVKHMNNSAGAINFSGDYDMTRVGIAMYGLYPSEEINKSLIELKPALQWVAKVVHIKTLSEGREISYGGTYVTKKKSVIATIPVGYADGYPRCLSNKGYVLINGKKAPITGRVCMDQFMVDVTDIENVAVGTEATLIGENGDEEISIEKFAFLSGSFNYEMLCRISKRVPRLY